ncbi:hypothetical protein EC973_009123 [Apophysomyces ossiformis]|uniref:Uncharacterized protein n=1 Tax=Apophysomyces ossiformis TaxID=679940 RepID=A0A8H7BRH9_9FUNG|nr:hypothetical protein EC973_009123 [Apophysomyces ossiformis]
MPQTRQSRKRAATTDEKEQEVNVQGNGTEDTKKQEQEEQQQEDGDGTTEPKKKRRLSKQEKEKEKEEKEEVKGGEIHVDEAKRTSTIEKGHIYFFYRPKLGTEKVETTDDVQRILIILKPFWSSTGNRKPTSIIIGRKHMPEVRTHERYWAFVEKSSAKLEEVTDRLEEHQYETKTRGDRTVKEARAMAQGVYAIATHAGHSHLAYMLTMPEKPSDVQKAFNIDKQSSLIISVKNPEKSSPPQAGLSKSQKAEFPKELMETFHDRRFVSMDTPDFLNYDNCELMLIGAKQDVTAELGKTGEALEDLTKEEEERIQYVGPKQTLFDELQLECKDHPIQPLEGKWE